MRWRVLGDLGDSSDSGLLGGSMQSPKEPAVKKGEGTVFPDFDPPRLVSEGDSADAIVKRQIEDGTRGQIEQLDTEGPGPSGRER